MNNLPLALKHLCNYQDLTDKKISSLYTRIMILSAILLIVMLGSFFLMLFFVSENFITENHTSHIFIAAFVFILSGGTQFEYLGRQAESLKLLENSSKEDIQEFNKLKNKKVAADYLKNDVLPFRSIYILDKIVIEYLIEQKELKILMNKANAV